MMFQGKKLFNASFDMYADNYQSVRPGYPTEMMDDIGRVSCISEDSRLLEIGAGSGIATISLAKIGSEIVALEPGRNLAEIAKKQLSNFSKVKVEVDTFENYTNKDRFDSILSFTSFHWLSGDNTFEHISDLLNFGGTLVISWNSFLQQDSDATKAVELVYQSDLSDIYPDNNNVDVVNKMAIDKVDGRLADLISNPNLEPIFLNRYLTIYDYDPETYAKFLATYPKIINLEDGRRNKFLGRVSDAVRNHGGIISVPVLSTVIICRKKTDFLSQVKSL